jgi:hypothetical protein
MSIRDGKLLYHLTELNNLETIIDYGLLSRDELINRGIKFDNVANSEILAFRKQHGLQKFVPFHFFPNTPFDGSVQKTYMRDEFIYLCLQRQVAREYNFKIIPRHPLSMLPFKMYNYVDGLRVIDWETMDCRDYSNYECKEICMAECIYDQPIPIDWFICINVKNENIKNYVEEVLYQYDINIHVNIMPSWFCN